MPILLAGNSYLLKTRQTCLARRILSHRFLRMPVSGRRFGWVNATNDGVSRAINDRRIAAVTVTGSVRAGAAIGAQAGAALKNACLSWAESSDLFIVLNDADLDLAVKAAVAGRYQNTGQVRGRQTLYC